MNAPLDVFVKLWPRHPLRDTMAQLVWQRLRMLDGVRVIPVTAIPANDTWPSWLDIPADHGLSFAQNRYHEYSKWGAAFYAKSDVYVVIDDDHLPLARDWATRGARVLHEHPEFSLLASWSVNGEVIPELVQRSVPGAHEDNDVFEAHGLGTPYFARRGEIPPNEFVISDTTAHTYDPAMSDMARKYGRVGFLKGVRHNHLGIGFSTVSGAHWEA